jgi:hypothetical protein
MALHNPDNLKDGHYANASKDAEGKPRPLEVGFFTFKPEQVRFVSVREAVRSGNGFRLSRQNGNLLGPFDTPDEAAAALGGKAPAKKAAPRPDPEPAAKEPEPEPEPEPPVLDPEPVVEKVKVTEDVKVSDDIFGGDEPTDPGKPKKKKSLKKKK